MEVDELGSPRAPQVENKLSVEGGQVQVVEAPDHINPHVKWRLLWEAGLTPGGAGVTPASSASRLVIHLHNDRPQNVAGKKSRR